MPTLQIATRLPEGAKVVPDAVLELLPMSEEALRDWSLGSDLCCALRWLYDKPCVVTIGDFSFEDDYAHYGLDKFSEAQHDVWETSTALHARAPELARSAEGLVVDAGFGGAMKHVVLFENVLDEVIEESAGAELRLLQETRAAMRDVRQELLTLKLAASAAALIAIAEQLHVRTERLGVSSAGDATVPGGGGPLWSSSAAHEEGLSVGRLLRSATEGAQRLVAFSRGTERGDEARATLRREAFGEWQRVARTSLCAGVVLVQRLSMWSVRTQRH